MRAGEDRADGEEGTEILSDAGPGIGERARRFLLREYWNIGVVDQTAANIAERGIATPVRWLPSPAPGTMLADPSCFIHADGRRTLFAEFLDHRAPRGEIWSAEVAAGEDLSDAKFRPLLNSPFHMSYPQPFADGGATFLTCESWQSGGIPFWQRTEDTWLPLTPLLLGKAVVDPTLFRWQGRWWLFCTLENDAPDARLHLFHTAALGGAWTAHPANPVRTDPSAARPAGPIFMMGETPIRPAQDCSRTYGGAVVLHAIVSLTPTAYEERTMRRLEPTGSSYPHGLHTICPAGDVTLIDGKRWGPDPVPLRRQLIAKTCKIWERTIGLPR